MLPTSPEQHVYTQTTNNALYTTPNFSISFQIEDFDKKGFRIIAFDALGHGKSNKPKRQSHYATSTFVKNALQIFRKYKSPSKNILVGHSYGTVVALHVLEHELNGCGGDQMKCSIKKIALLGSFPRPKPVPPALPWIPSFVLVGSV